MTIDKSIIRSACMAALHRFRKERSCEPRDMCIDAAGVLLGAAFLLLILHLIQRKKLKR